MGSLPFFLSLGLVLISLSHGQPMPDASPDPVPDPGCMSGRGIRSGGACCPASCGQCGGMGCQLRVGGGSCCTNIVSRLGRDCDLVGPPCFVGIPPGISPSPSPASLMVSPVPPTPSAIPTLSPAPTPTSNLTGNLAMWRILDVQGQVTRRVEGCFVMVRGRGYLLGGRGGAIVTNIFNPRNRSWTTGAPPPFEFHHAKCIAVGTNIFVPFSWTGSFPTETENTRMLVYNVNSDRWTTRPGLPRRRNRAAAAAVLFDRKIYVVGGARRGHGMGLSTVGFFDFYDLATREWVSGLPSLPSRRDHTAGAIVQGRLCVVGGRIGELDTVGRLVRTTFCYDFGMERWMNAGAPLPGVRANSAVARLCDGRMMVAGGEGMRFRAFARVDIFNGTGWTRGPNLVRGRHGTGLGVANCMACGQVFIAGGQGGRMDMIPLGSTEVFFRDGMDRTCLSF